MVDAWVTGEEMFAPLLKRKVFFSIHGGLRLVTLNRHPPCELPRPHFFKRVLETLSELQRLPKPGRDVCSYSSRAHP